MRKIGVTIIGRGFGARIIQPACRQHPFIEIRSIVAANAGGEAAIGGVPVLKDLHAEVSRSDVDLVVVASPHHLHEQHVRLCLSAGKHTLCEKPLALSYVKASSLLKQCRSTEVVGAMDYNFRFIPARRKMAELVGSGRIGQVRKIRMCFHRDDFDKWPAAWYYKRECGGGALMATGSHLVDSMRQLLPDAIRRAQATIAYERGIDVGFLLELITESGVVGEIDVSHRCTGAGKHMTTIHGSVGILEIGLNQRLTIRSAWGSSEDVIFTNATKSKQHRIETWSPVYDVLDAVVGEIRNNEQRFQLRNNEQQFQFGFFEGAENQRILDAAQLSHAEKRPVMLDEIEA